LLGGTATTTTVVLPVGLTGTEACKHLAVAGVEIITFTNIFRIYFDEHLTPNQIKNLLVEASLALVVGGTLVYTSIKTMHVLAMEALNLIPVIGWLTTPIINAVVTGSMTLVTGAAWIALCDLWVQDPPEFVQRALEEARGARTALQPA